MSYIGKQPVVGNFQVCDAITVVNGQAAYTMQVSSANVTPESANHMLVSLNGILQKPGSSFTISGSTITFASNLATGDVIDFIILLGNVLDIGTPSDGTITNAKLAQDIISGETALTSQPASTDELLISDAGTLKRIDFSLISNTPAFEAYYDGSQTLSDATTTKLEFDTERFDSDGTFASNRFTPGVAGKYFVYSKSHWGTGTSTTLMRVYLYLYKNGGQIAMTNIDTRDGGNFRVLGAEISATVDLDADDYVEIYAFVDTSSGSPAGAGASEGQVFGGFKIIGV